MTGDGVLEFGPVRLAQVALQDTALPVDEVGGRSHAHVAEAPGDLAAAETSHEKTAVHLTDQYLGDKERSTEDQVARRQFILTWVQPGLAGHRSTGDLAHPVAHVPGGERAGLRGDPARLSVTARNA